jgi:succinate-acetate transporter protein
MSLDACKHALVVWDFATSDFDQPGILNIRLTDVAPSPQTETSSMESQQANTNPVALFSFCIVLGLESTDLLNTMFGDSALSPLFTLTYGPLMLFMGGLLQLVVGILQVFRNNIYGATAFLGFGTNLLAFGTTLILNNYFAVPGTAAHEILASHKDDDAVGQFIQNMFLLSFTVALCIQTFRMNQLSTILLVLLGIKIVFSSLAGFVGIGMQYAELAMGYVVCLFAFYVFLVEFTNNVYQRDVFNMYKWSDDHSPEEVFGATGKTGTLRSQASRLLHTQFFERHDPKAALSRTVQGKNGGEYGKESFPNGEKNE